MAATVYYVLCENGTNKVCDARTDNSFADGLVGLNRFKASFSDDPADNPDVLKSSPDFQATMAVSEAGAPATLTVDGVDSDGDVVYSSVFNGDTDPSVAHVTGDVGEERKGRVPALQVTGLKFTVVFGTDAEGISVTPTASEVAALVNAHPIASKYVSAAAGGTGTSQVGEVEATALSGGSPDTFTYTNPSLPCLTCEWSGDGAADPDDGVYEMTSNGVNTATLTIKKCNSFDDTPLPGDSNDVTISALGQVSLPFGRVTLDKNGEAEIPLTPTSGEKGQSYLRVLPINASYPGCSASIRFV